MILVNAIINVPEDVDYRMHLRNQLFSVGFGKMKVKLELYAQSNEFLHRQMETFNHYKDEDWRFYQEFYENLREKE